MKYLFTIVIALFIISCNGNDGPIDEPEEVYDFFSEAWLLSDSINMLLKMNEPQTIETTEGDMGIWFDANEACPINEEACGFCDPLAAVHIYLKHAGDTVSLQMMSLYRCALPFSPIFYETINCDRPDFNSSYDQSTLYENLIYNVKELYPYPHTVEETEDFYYNNKYYLNLTILNKCEP